MERVTKAAFCILAIVVLLAAAGCGEKETKTESKEVKQQPRQTQQRQYQTQQRQPISGQQQTYQQPSAQTVYIAPYSGKKYHPDRNCRALRNARSVQAVTKQQAVQAGYQPCGICAK